MDDRSRLLYGVSFLLMLVMALSALIVSGFAMLRATALQKVLEGEAPIRSALYEGGEYLPAGKDSLVALARRVEALERKTASVDDKLSRLSAEMKLAVASNMEDLDQRIADSVTRCMQQMRRQQRDVMVEQAMRLVQPEQEGYLGVHPANMEPDVGIALHAPQGVGALVVEVIPDSPADKAGVELADVILRVGETPVIDAPSLTRAVRSAKPGDKVTIEYLRAGELGKTEVTLGSGRDRYKAVGRVRREYSEMQRNMSKLRHEIQDVRRSLQAMEERLSDRTPAPKESVPELHPDER